MAFQYDGFCSHASEDKEEAASPLVLELTRLGARIWYDKFELSIGDSLRAKIDLGLNESRQGILILSPSFFNKPWPKAELDALFQLYLSDENRRLLPVYHRISYEEVQQHSPLIASIKAGSTAYGIVALARELAPLLVPGMDSIQIGQSVKIAPSFSRCKSPRKFFESAEPEGSMFRISPYWVERPSGEGPYFAPYPFKISGLKPETIEQAKRDKRMIILRDTMRRPSDQDGTQLLYQYVTLAAPEVEDEPCMVPRD